MDESAATAALDPAAGRVGVASLARRLATETTLVWSLVGVGVVLRLVRFLDERALWGDEARLALNLTGRSFGALFDRLDFVQAAPFGFLLAEKSAVELLGDGELGLRAVSVAAGIASLAVFVGLARRTLDGAAIAVAVALFAVAEPLVYYSAEVKQYSVDVLVAVVLLYLAFRAVDEGAGYRALVVLTAVGAAAPWLSHPSVFVLAGIFAGLVQVRSRDGRGRLAVVTLGVVWLASFAAVYLLARRNLDDVQAALHLGDGQVSVGLRGLARTVWEIFAGPVGLARTSIALALLLCALGAVGLLRRRRFHLVVLGGTLLAMLAAVYVQRYPTGTRFAMFIVPVFVLLVAQGIETLRARTADRVRLGWAAAAVLLLAYPAGIAATRAADPPRHEEIKPVIAYLDERWRPGDAVYVSRVAQFPLRYYAECRDCDVFPSERARGLRELVLDARTNGRTALGTASPTIYVGRIERFQPAATYSDDFRSLPARPRVWVLLSSSWDAQLTTLLLDCLGDRKSSFERSRAAVYLYDLGNARDRRETCLPAR